MNQKNKILNFNKICRTCMGERGELKSLFNATIGNMLMVCFPVKVEKNDGLPTNICLNCYNLVNKYYAFRNKIEKCDKELRNYLSEQNTKKSDKNIIEQAASNANIDITVEFCKIEEEYIEPNINHIPVNRHSEKHIKTTEDKYALKNVKLETALAQQIFTDGPPPLVPLAPIAPEAIPDFPADNAITEQALKPISTETPPLIPIKPATSNTTLITLETAIEQALKFSCSACELDFPDQLSLKSHITSVHSNTSNLTCNICKKEFSDRKRLIGHLKGHMIVKHYACKLCGKRYPNPSTFRVHMRTHTGERPFKCQLCNKGFVRWAGVVGHMRTHTEHKPYMCGHCGKGFKVASNLERHKILHAGIMPFCCNYCGKTFTQSDNLQLHIRTYHTHERPFLCSECGKGFVSLTRLKRHMWIHSGYKPYTCKVCNKSYSNSNDLKNHEKTHNGGIRESDKPYACVECDMRFLHRCRLVKHMKTHEKRFSCHECMKNFRREEALHKHIISKHNNAVTHDVVVQQEDENNMYVLPDF